MTQKSACGYQQKTNRSSILLLPIAASLRYKNYQTQQCKWTRESLESLRVMPNHHQKIFRLNNTLSRRKYDVGIREEIVSKFEINIIFAGVTRAKV